MEHTFFKLLYIISYYNVVSLILLTLYKKSDKVNINQMLERYLR